MNVVSHVNMTSFVKHRLSFPRKNIVLSFLAEIKQKLNLNQRVNIYPALTNNRN